MRRWFVAFCLLGVASHAAAQDFDTPTLRGSSPFIPAPPKYTPWSGFYVGGQVGYAFSNMDATNAFESVNIFDPNNPLTAPLGSVSTWTALGRKDVRAASYGGFVGYNTQWDDAIIGIELNYNHSSLFGSWSSSRCYDETNLACFGAITLGDGNAYNATVVATTSARITDYGTLRGRGAWAYGNLLPYAFAGVAVARAEVANAATVDATPTATSLGVAFVHTERDARTRFTWGYSLGVGIDFLVTPNVFLRGEYEYIKLNAVGGVELAIDTARFGAGVKF